MVIGAASSSVSLNVVDTFADNKIVEISPANTAVDLSGYSPFYFRTAPPDGVQGNALGTLITTDGYTKVGFWCSTTPTATGLRNAVQETVEAAGSCVYGCNGKGQEFPPGQTTFSSEVSGVLAAEPNDRGAGVRRDQVRVVPELKAQGWDMKEDLLRRQHRRLRGDFAMGTLTDAQGTIPGADPDQAFKDRLQGWNQGQRREAEGLLLRCRVLRRHHPRRARRGEATPPTRDDPEEPG